MRIGRYLLDTRKHGIIYMPDKSKGLECYVDADFAGGWSQADAENADNVLSRTDYIIIYANCPILWVSHLQTEIALSTAKAEYIPLSQALRDVISLITLLKEINKVFPVHVKTPKFVCKVHEDNQSSITMHRKSLLLARSTSHLNTIIFALTSRAVQSKFHIVVRLNKKPMHSQNLWPTISSSKYGICLVDGS
jgi:hypothetical protein